MILGHASPLNAFLLTADEKYIVTADRDEHIRVSWYPKGYNIEMYCLGHLKYDFFPSLFVLFFDTVMFVSYRFVSAIHIPESDPTRLISGGGDPMLKIWDWMTGALKHEVAVLDVVEPFMVVRALKRKRGHSDVDDGEDLPEGARVKRKKCHRKGKGKEKGKGKDKEADGEDGEGEVEADENKEEGSKPEKVLVIHKIDTLSTDSVVQVIFSAVGYVVNLSLNGQPDADLDEKRHGSFYFPIFR